MGRLRTKNRHLPPRMQLKGGRYYWTPYVDGKLKWQPLGDDYVKAMLKWRELEGINEGAATLGQLLDRALGVMADEIGAGTFREFTRALNRLKAAFEGFTPSDVTPQHIAQYLETRKAKVSANREVAFFSAAWEIARRRGWINLPNPATGVRRNAEKKRKRVAKPDEIAALLSADERLTDMVEITLMTAIRESDLLNLTLHAVERGGLRIKPRKTEASSEAELFFPWATDGGAQLRAVIERAKSRRRKVSSIYLFPVTKRERAGQPYTVNTFQGVWRRYFERCGVSGLTWHDLRRTALNLRQRESGKEAAQALAAHSSITTTEGYLSGVGAVEVAPVVLNFRKGV